MKKWLKRIRGAFRMGLVWAAAWAGVGAIVGVVAAVLGFDPASGIVEGAAVGVIIGFFAGATFSTVLGITEGRRRFDEMSLPRFAGWGAVGGVLLQLVMVGLGQTTRRREYGRYQPNDGTHADPCCCPSQPHSECATDALKPLLHRKPPAGLPRRRKAWGSEASIGHRSKNGR